MTSRDRIVWLVLAVSAAFGLCWLALAREVDKPVVDSELPDAVGENDPGTTVATDRPLRSMVDLATPPVSGAGESRPPDARLTDDARMTDMDRILAMHLQPASEQLHRAHEWVAGKELEFYRAEADKFAEKSGEGLGNYLEYLVAFRQQRLRELTLEALAARRGLLEFPDLGKDAKQVDPNLFAMRYLGVEQHHGRYANLLVPVDSKKLEELSTSIKEIGDAAVAEAVEAFNRLPEEVRRSALAEEIAAGARLPGFGREVMSVARRRLVRLPDLALLSLK